MRLSLFSFVIPVFIVSFSKLLVPGEPEPSSRGAPKKRNLIWLTPLPRSGDCVKRRPSLGPATPCTNAKNRRIGQGTGVRPTPTQMSSFSFDNFARRPHTDGQAVRYPEG